MFINKKSLTKIWLVTGAYLAVSLLCFLIAAVFIYFDIDCTFHIIIGVVFLAVSYPIYKFGRYAEGKGILIGNGQKLIHQQLKPAEFVRLYEERRDDSENVVAKPDCDMLHMLADAYDALGDRNQALETAQLAISVAPEKKRNVAILMKCSLLFSIGEIDEAERIYRDVLNKDLNMITKSIADVVMRSDRAMALKDYTTAEAYFRELLNRNFPKTTPLGVLYAHWHLAKICETTGKSEEARLHLDYCVQNGGETNISQEAALL